MPRGGAGYLDQSLAGQSRWSLALSLVRAYDNSSAHNEFEGLSEDGEVVALPLHEHDIRLNVARLELNLQYIIRADWAVRLFLPYERKDQSVAAVRIAPMTEQEWAAAQRGSQRHHQTVEKDGFTDGLLRVLHSRTNLFAAGDQLTISPGLTLPFGETSPRPDIEGRHFLLQFGNGTYDPMLDISYFNKATANLELLASISQRYPLDTNDHGFRGSRETSWRAGASYSWDLTRLTASVNGIRTGFATWDGEPNYNTGIESYDGALSLGIKLPGEGYLNATVSLPISRRNRSELGDSFDRGATFWLGYSLPIGF